MSKEDIAKLVNLSLSMVRKITASPYFQKKLERALQAYEKKRAETLAVRHESDKTLDRLEKAANKASIILTKALRGDNTITKQQISVAKDILDRSGYKAKDKVELETTHKTYTPEEIESAQLTMLEMSETLERLSVRGTNFLISGPAKRSETEEDAIDAECKPEEPETPLETSSD